jgi:rubrerythrin
VYEEQQRLLARSLREEGLGYRTIAKSIDGPSPTTIKRWTCDIPSTSREAFLKSMELEKEGRFPKRKSSVRKRLIEERGHRCEVCSGEMWLELPITLEVHRKDPDGGYTRENTVLMCPNCHSQTDSWRKKVIAPLVER